MVNRIANSWVAWPVLFFLTFLVAAPGVFNLPAIDRDESRFAQASKEMLEEGDYIRIQYQETLRNKKPAGIHWMQAGATRVLSDDYNKIWTYRVPSWIGASLAVLATFWAGIALVGRRAAFLGALMFGAGVLLTSEAHISKTDGQLVLWTTLALGVLARFYTGKTGETDKGRRALALLFWFAIGVNSLIKGPVGPMVVAFGGLGVWLLDKRAGRQTGQWKGLFWWPGPMLAAMMFVPWFIWIQMATRGQFVKGAVGKDLWDKFFSFSEGHGGIPGYHLGHIAFMFFPATLFVVPAVVMAWRHWRGTQSYENTNTNAIRFLVCWVGLTWIFFELLLTKLSHYILPAYPGLALLCGWAAVEIMERGDLAVSRWLSFALFSLGGVVLFFISTPFAAEWAATQAAGEFTTVKHVDVLAFWGYANSSVSVKYFTGLWVLGVVGFVITILSYLFRRYTMAIVSAIIAVGFFGFHVRTHFLPHTTWAHPTRALGASLASINGYPKALNILIDAATNTQAGARPDRVEVFGYAEPSFLLEFGTENLHTPQSQIKAPVALPAVYVFNLEEQIGREAFAYFESLQGFCKTYSQSYYGANYSNGSPVNFVALRIGDLQGCKKG